MVFGEPGFRETLFVRQVPSLFNSDAILMIICVYQVAGEFQVCSAYVVFDAVTEPARVEERLALAVMDRGPWLAVWVDATLKAGFDPGNPSDADLVQAFLDVRVRGAEVPDFAHELLQG